MKSESVTQKKSLLVASEVFEHMSLHLDDVEMLRNAFAAQALVGPLIRFSNRGRYEPYVAKSWTQSGNEWIFDLHDGLKCEDGQTITPESFRESLKRSLLRFKLDEIKEMPFADLKGIDQFLRNKNDSQLGISAHHHQLRLIFTKPVGKALLEYLAMTPFAFLCDGNFHNGQWKSRDQFISSGPYRLRSFDPKGNFCELGLRADWALNPAGAFDRVYLSDHDLPGVQPAAKIQMTYAWPKTLDETKAVREVPRALLSVRLGLGAGHFFNERARRRVLQGAMREILNQTDVPFDNYHRAESFFFGQVTGHEVVEESPRKVDAPLKPLVIRSRPQGESKDVDFYQGILFKALEHLGWKYELDVTPVTGVAQFHHANYDIAYDRSHVDATLDPEFVRLLFKSNLGPRFQDPGHRISKLVEAFDRGQMSYRDFLISFNMIISEEAAIIPMYHRGFTWTFTNNVDVKNISPLMSVLRYEELAIQTDGT